MCLYDSLIDKRSCIEVVGKGNSEVLPDQITVVFRLCHECEGSDLQNSELTKQVHDLTTALESYMKEGDSISASPVSVTLHIGDDDVYAEGLVTVSVTTSRLVDAVLFVEIGEKFAEIDYCGTCFTLSEALKEQGRMCAIEGAVADAKRSAEMTASALGVRLSELVSVSVCDDEGFADCVSSGFESIGDVKAMLIRIDVSVKVLYRFES